VIKRGEFKDLWSEYRAITPEERKLAEHLVDVYYEYFRDVLVERTGFAPDYVENHLMTGWIWFGFEAKTLGLVDEVF